MTVVILGSKPNPIITEQYESIIFINGSISHINSLSVSEEIRVYHFVTYAMMIANHVALNEFKNKKVNKLIISGGDMDEEESYLSLLKDQNYIFDEHLIWPKKERAQLVNTMVGKIKNISIAFNKEINYRKGIKNILALMRGEGLERASLRPSTSVLVLLYVLYYKLGDPPYYLCGSGILDDGHCYDSNLGFNTKHLYYDISILKALSLKKLYYKQIIVTDHELAEATNLRNKQD